MRTTCLFAILSVTVLLGACAKPEPSAFVPGQAPTFPLRSDGVFEDIGARRVEKCRVDGHPDDPDCVLRIKQRIVSCHGQVPGVFDTEGLYLTYTNKFKACLETR